MATRPSMQKISIAVERIAWDLLCLDVGDRVRSIDEYHNRLGVSSGTVKNALDYLESTGAASFSRHGHEGTIVEHMDYRALQRSCTRGIRPRSREQDRPGRIVDLPFRGHLPIRRAEDDRGRP